MLFSVFVVVVVVPVVVLAKVYVLFINVAYISIKLRHGPYPRGPYITNFHLDLQLCLLFAMKSL